MHIEGLIAAALATWVLGFFDSGNAVGYPRYTQERAIVCTIIVLIAASMNLLFVDFDKLVALLGFAQNSYGKFYAVGVHVMVICVPMWKLGHRTGDFLQWVSVTYGTPTEKPRSSTPG